MGPLYFAPINAFGNPVYRHLLLRHKADFVFSELLQADRWDKEILKQKLFMIKEDLPKTIFQIGVSDKEELIFAVSKLVEEFTNPREININMGCPQSSMQERKTCGGLLSDMTRMRKVCEQLVQSCAERNIIPSVKLRLGTSPEDIHILDYLNLLQDLKIQKVYIHARPLRYNYAKEALYEELFTLQEKFPHLELIFNGDIDSYEAANKLAPFCKGLMIGRAALFNPLIFEQIKAATKTRFGAYNPILKDPHTSITPVGTRILAPLKRAVFAEFIEMSEIYHLRRDLRDMNLVYMTKGLSTRGPFIKDISKKSAAQLQELLHTL